jgi:hypothetical protein
LEENMEKKVAGLLGAVAALGTLNGAQAAPTPNPPDTLKVNSYADLLEPIPNALDVLRQIEDQSPVKPWEDNVKVAQFYHHHHHHGYYHHHHHGYYHHHHHHGYYRPRIIVVPPRRYHHHHHHHGYYRY